jgi:hypothetical protein
MTPVSLTAGTLAATKLTMGATIPTTAGGGIPVEAMAAEEETAAVVVAAVAVIERREKDIPHFRESA